MPFKDKERRYAANKVKDDLMKWLLRTIKGKMPCADCGQYYPWYIMEFDHPNGIKHRNFPKSKSGAQTNARIRRRPVVSHCTGWSDLFRELREVVVVCANCHRARSFQRGEWGRACDLD